MEIRHGSSIFPVAIVLEVLFRAYVIRIESPLPANYLENRDNHDRCCASARIISSRMFGGLGLDLCRLTQRQGDEV